MKTKIFLFIGLIGLISILPGCEKDETKVVISDNPVLPEIVSMPNLALARTNAGQTLLFTGTKVDPGFQASATYFLEVDAQGANFANPLILFSGVRPDSITFTVSELNGQLLRKFPADQVSAAEFRLRTTLTVDAGTGALGTSTRPLQYTSETRPASVTVYGLPRLDLVNSGFDQRIESPAGDASYSGYVKLDPANPFTLRNPDTGTVYGAEGDEKLAINGSAFVSSSIGWYSLAVNVDDLTYSLNPYMVGLVGSATPNGWDAPDQKMDYDAQTGTWSITLDLVVGHIKFRRNDVWSWELGHDESGSITNLVVGGYGNDIPISAAGNYTITLTIIGESGGSCTIVKN